MTATRESGAGGTSADAHVADKGQSGPKPSQENKTRPRRSQSRIGAEAAWLGVCGNIETVRLRRKAEQR